LALRFAASTRHGSASAGTLSWTISGLHDLRHSFASVGAAGGLSLPIIGALLGHKHSATTARYAHLSADPLRAANDVVGARIAAAMNRKEKAIATADVVALPSRKGDAAR
jgi:integrase